MRCKVMRLMTNATRTDDATDVECETELKPSPEDAKLCAGVDFGVSPGVFTLTSPALITHSRKLGLLHFNTHTLKHANVSTHTHTHTHTLKHANVSTHTHTHTHTH